MNKLYSIKKPEFDVKTIYVFEQGIQAMDKSYSDLKSFQDGFSQDSNSFLETKDDIQYSNVLSLSTFKDDFGVQIVYTKSNGKIDKAYLEFEKEEDCIEVMNYVVFKSGLESSDFEGTNRKAVYISYIVTFIVTSLMILAYLKFSLPFYFVFVIIGFMTALFFWVKVKSAKQELEKERFTKP